MVNQTIKVTCKDMPQNFENIISITIRQSYLPQIYNGNGTMTYIPGGKKFVTLKLSDLIELDNIRAISLTRLRELLLENIHGIDIEEVTIAKNVKALKINWNNIKIVINENSMEGLKEHRTPIAVRVLTILEKRPIYITKGQYGFKGKLAMKIDEFDKIVFVGEGAMYFFNHNGFNYIRQSKLNELRRQGCKDLKGILEHREKDFTGSKYDTKIMHILKK